MLQNLISEMMPHMAFTAIKGTKNLGKIQMGSAQIPLATL